MRNIGCSKSYVLGVYDTGLVSSMDVCLQYDTSEYGHLNGVVGCGRKEGAMFYIMFSVLPRMCIG